MNNRSRIAALALPPGLLLLLFFILPMLVMATFTFREGSFGAARNVFTLDHYREFLSSTVFHRLLLRSTLIALETSVYSIILAYPLAYYLVFHAGPRRGILVTLILVPAWTSFLLRILAWKLILGSEGLVSTVLVAIGALSEPQPVLLYSRAAVVVALVYSWLPFVALPIMAALDRIEKNLLEAAADLGCPPWRAFLRVTLPLSLPGVAAGFFFVFIPTLGEWVTPSLVGGVSGIMYGNIIQSQFVSALNWPIGALMSLLMLLLMLAILAVLSRFAKSVPLEGLTG